MKKPLDKIILMYIFSILFGASMIGVTFYFTAHLKQELQVKPEVMMSFHDLVQTIVSTVVGSQSIGVSIYNALKKNG